MSEAADITITPQQIWVGWGYSYYTNHIIASTPEAACQIRQLDPAYIFLDAVSTGDPESLTCRYTIQRSDGSMSGPQYMQLVVKLYRQICDAPFRLGTQCFYTPAVGKNEGPPCLACGNPVNGNTGNKYQLEPIYRSGGTNPLELVMYYNSVAAAANAPLLFGYDLSSTAGSRATAMALSTTPIAMVLAANAAAGVGTAAQRNKGEWLHTFSRNVLVNAAGTTAWVHRHDGTTYVFTLSNNAWVSDADVNGKLNRTLDGNGNPNGWRYTTPEDDVEIYDVSGKLQSITTRSGWQQTLTYNGSGQLITVTDSSGKTLTFGYGSSGELNTLTDPAQNVYTFNYDTSGNLAGYSTPDNKTRIYAYENTAFPNALTGIIDENNNRFATWNYDTQGRAYSSEHAVGVEKVTLAFNTGTTTVTDAIGTSQTYHFQTLQNIAHVDSVSRPAVGTYPAGSRSITYDSNANKSSETDWNGNKTCYGYDLTRNLQTARVEGLASSAVCSTALTASSLTAPARKISTQWDATYRLPLEIAEPKKLTTFTYDSSGNLLTKTEQATTDTSGTQGFTATTTGTARTWTYTYNSVGQVLTVDGPRTDVTDVTTYTYDTSGNLTSITDAAGLVTAFSNYDANGRAGHIAFPDGKTTDLTYSPRGWLTQADVSDGTHTQTTGYTYDGTGNLIGVTLPDSSTLTYTYDDAHRLTDITDNVGNTVHYVLDNMGNRTTEQVKDPGGTLTRQITRVYDALNRLQTITGGVQ